MFSSFVSRGILRSLALRLTLSNILSFGLVSVLGVFLIYFSVVFYLRSAIDAELFDEFQEMASYVMEHNLDAVCVVFEGETEAEGPTKLFFRLITRENEVIVSSDTSAWGTEELSSAWPSEPRDERIILRTIKPEGKGSRTRVISGEITPGKILQIGIRMDRDEDFLAHFRDSTVVILIGMLSLGGLVGWRATQKAVAGVEEVRKATERIAGGNFDERVNVTRYGEEIERLGNTFNCMAERIQTLMTEMSQVNDNIAHDLRSPIARIRGFAEDMAVRNDIPLDCRESAGIIVENCDRLLQIINTMLEISETESGVRSLDVEQIDLCEIVSEATDLFLPIAEQKNIVLRRQTDNVPSIKGNRKKIQRALANLIDNASKYTNPGGEVSITLTTEDGSVCVAVRDNGVGIAPEDHNKIFDRFYRGDRSRSQPGNGLGLSLALAIARAHRGCITFQSSPDKGSTFRFVLPSGPPSS